MKIRHTIWGGLLLALAACSGGGGGGGGGALAPAAVPTSFEATSGTTTFNAVSTVAIYSDDLSTGSTGITNISADVRITVNFDTGEVRIQSRQATDAGTVFLLDDTVSVVDGSLQTFDTGLKYTAFGAWAVLTANRVGAGALGFVTPTNDIPTTGTARYTGITVGIGAEAGTAYAVGGRVTLDANFGTGEITGLLHDMVRTDIDLNADVFEDVNILASMNGGTSTYSGTTSSTRPGFSSGDVEGAFFGPGAAETGGAWRLLANEGDDAYIGSYGATQ